MYEVLQVGGRHDAGRDRARRCSCCCSPGWRSPSCRRWRASSSLLLRPQDALGIDTGAALPAITRPDRHAAADLQRGSRPRAGAACGRSASRSSRPGRPRSSTGSSSATPPIPRSGSRRRRRSCGCAPSSGPTACSIATAPHNTARKSGNIEDWVKRFGAGYDSHADPRRRQPDDAATPSCGLPRAMERASGRRADPDAADRGQRQDAVRAACSSSPAGSTAR